MVGISQPSAVEFFSSFSNKLSAIVAPAPGGFFAFEVNATKPQIDFIRTDEILITAQDSLASFSNLK